MLKYNLHLNMIFQI